MIVELIPNTKPNDPSAIQKEIKKRRHTGNASMALTNSINGECTLTPVTARAFEKWIKRDPDLILGIQYVDETLTWPVMHEPHDGASGQLAEELMANVRYLMPSVADLKTLK